MNIELMQDIISTLQECKKYFVQDHGYNMAQKIDKMIGRCSNYISKEIQDPIGGNINAKN